METNQLQKPLIIIQTIHEEILSVLDKQSKRIGKNNIADEAAHKLLFEKVNLACGFDKNGFKNAIGAIETFKFAHNLIDFFYYHILSQNRLYTGLKDGDLPGGTRFILVVGILNAAFQQLQAVKTFLNLSDLNKTYKADLLNRIDLSELITTRHKIASHNANCRINSQGDLETFFPRFLDGNMNEINFFNSKEIYGKDVDIKKAIFDYYHLIENPLLIILEEIISRIYKKNDEKIVKVQKKMESFKPTELSLLHKIQNFEKIRI